VLLLPIFAIPNSPIFSEVPGLPSLTLLTASAKLNVAVFISIIIILLAGGLSASNHNQYLFGKIIVNIKKQTVP
jgi:hypothetical protein